MSQLFNSPSRTTSLLMLQPPSSTASGSRLNKSNSHLGIVHPYPCMHR